MASLNGRYIQLTAQPEKPIGRVAGWREESDWVKVTFQDGSHQMVHCTDRFDILPADFTWKP